MEGSHKGPGHSSVDQCWSSWTWSSHSSALALSLDLHKRKGEFFVHFFPVSYYSFDLKKKKEFKCSSHLQTAPVRRTTQCSSVCSRAAESSHCPAHISDQHTKVSQWNSPGGCWEVHNIPHLETDVTPQVWGCVQNLTGTTTEKSTAYSLKL